MKQTPIVLLNLRCIPNGEHILRLPTLRSMMFSKNTPIRGKAQSHEENLFKLSPEQAEVWLDLIEKTGRTPEGLGITAHFLYIGQK